MDAARIAQSALGSVRPAREWLERFARWGFIANAVVYLLVGSLLMRWALGNGGHITGSDGAFLALRREAGGNLLLIALVPGFFSYAVWRILAAVFDGDGDGSSLGGRANRAFGVIKGCAYAALGIDATRTVLRAPASGNEWVQQAFSSGAGPILMVLVGAGLCAFAAFEAYRACTARLSQGLLLHEVGWRARAWIVGISRFGIGARSAVIGAFGILLFRAAARGSARAPRATESIHTVAQSSTALYAILAAGLVAYGLYLIVLARYRRVRTV